MASKKLNGKQTQAIELLAKGLQQKQVASMVGVDENTVYRWCKREDFRRLRDEKIKELFKDFSASALATAVEIMNDSSQRASDRLKASFDILDRAGYKPVEKSETHIEGVEIKIDYGDDA